jgi:Fe-S-cluster containining protein
MHAVADAGIEKEARSQERRRKARRACRRGCSVCCRHQSDIPVLPIELAGISWYCVEQLAGEVRETVRGQFERHTRAGACPFLVDDACAVHPVRPLACRLFTVFGRACAEGEDPFHARRADLLTPPAGLLARVYREMLPFHGVTEPQDQDEWLERRLVESLAVNLAGCNWGSLAGLMARVR